MWSKFGVELGNGRGGHVPLSPCTFVSSSTKDSQWTQNVLIDVAPTSYKANCAGQ